MIDTPVAVEVNEAQVTRQLVDGSLRQRGLGRNGQERAGTGRNESHPSLAAASVTRCAKRSMCPVALALCVSGVDLPLTGLCCPGLACAARSRPVAAGVVLAAACSQKWTVWPAVAVAVALLGWAGGIRVAVANSSTSAEPRGLA